MLGCGCGVVAVFLAIITALPLLGWANWVLTLPVALIAALVSFVGLMRGKDSFLSLLGLTVSVLTIFWALFRLGIGGGLL